MSARTILNPPLNNILSNISDTAVNGGVITFSPVVSVGAGAYTTATFSLPWVLPSGSTDGLSLVFNSIPQSGSAIQLFATVINAYTAGDDVSVSITFVNTSTTTTANVDGFYWVGYIGTASTVDPVIS